MVDLVDHYGNPIRRDDLEHEVQTSRLAHLYREFGEHPSSGLTPARLANILRAAEQGDLRGQADLFEDMEEKDGHILAEMGKRKRALLGLDWEILPPRNATAAEQRVAEGTAEMVEDLDLAEILLDMGDAIGHGYANLEIDWEHSSRDWFPRSIDHRPAGWFTVPRHNRDEIRLRSQGKPDGEELWPFGWIQHIHKAKTGYVTRAGLHRCLAWPYLFKNYSVRDLAEFLEIYGLPLRLGTYPHGATDREKATLLRAVMGIGHAAAGIVPKGMEIEFKEAAEGRSDPFVAMLDWCERTQSKAILGATLTSQADRGSNTNALGSVHNEVRQDLRDADARQYAKTLTRDLLWPLAVLNFGAVEPGRGPRFSFDTQEPEDIKSLAETLPKLVGIGVRIPASWPNEKLRIPEPQKDEAVLQPPSAAPRPPAALKRRTRGAAALRTDPSLPEAGPEQLAEGQAEDWETQLAGLVEPVLDLADQADSYEQFQRMLPQLLEQMDSQVLTEALARSQFAAHVWGRVHDQADEE